MDVEKIARVCHEVNRAYCQALGDDSQPTWEDAPNWQWESARLAVHFHIDFPDAPPSSTHDRWMADKNADGWKHGPEKDPHLKEHPCMVPFDQLPVEQRAKDYIFAAIVRMLRQL